MTIPQFVILLLLAALISGVAEERVGQRNLGREGGKAVMILTELRAKLEKLVHEGVPGSYEVVTYQDGYPTGKNYCSVDQVSVDHKAREVAIE